MLEKVNEALTNWFNLCSSEITKTKVDHLRTKFTKPENTMGRWEFVCSMSPKDPKEMSAEHLALLNKASWVFIVTLYKDQVEVNLNGIVLFYSYKEFMSMWEMYKIVIKTYFPFMQM